MLIGAAEASKAQAQAIVSDSSSAGIGDGKLLLVRRNVPRFIGKRDPAEAEIDNTEYTDKSFDDINSIDNYVEDLLEHYDDLDLNDIDTEAIKEYLLSDDIADGLDTEDIEDLEDEEYDDDKSSFETQEEKRYQPSFVGKRTSYGSSDFNSPLVGKRYRPMFVGKRYRPMFVGKRYRPMFVGKRYQPKFIGKRYTPKFIGKRFTPRFVGKRYTPKFIGKRYTPKFIGKRYTPKFIGKRWTPKFIGKRESLDITEKRFQPVFVGKKSSAAPMFLGKRYVPSFVGKRDDQEMAAEANQIKKRSVPQSNIELDNVEEQTEHNQRRKRSVMDNTEDDIKRAWRTYMPWNMQSAYIGGEPAYLEKRFVAPEFIGRRDSLSTILSALDALQFARNQPRSASKRFEAPLFIGKRGQVRPMFIGKRNPIFTNEMSLPDGDFEITPGAPEFNMDTFERVLAAYRSSPYRDMISYYGHS